MDKRQIVVLLVILAGTFVAAEVKLVDGTDPELFESEVGTVDGTIDPVVRPNIVDVSSGLPIFQATENVEVSNQSVAAPVPMGAPVPLEAPASTGGRTKIQVEKIEYKWTIMNYQHHGMEYDEPLYSPVFSGDNSEEYQWQLQLYPRGNDKTWKTYASLYLASVGKDGAKPDVTLAIINNVGARVNIKKFNDHKFMGNSKGFSLFVPHYTIEKTYHTIWCPDDRLTLVAEIIFSPGIKNSGCTGSSETECLAMPYDNNENSDVHLFLANHENIRAQKAALAAHSTWFAERFRQDLRINAVALPSNVNGDELKEAIKFIYTGQVNPSMAQKLKALADVLGMPKLKAMCEEVLCQVQNSAAAAA